MSSRPGSGWRTERSHCQETRFVLRLIIRATIRSFENTEYQYRMGLFDQTEYQAYVTFIESYFQNPSTVDWWSQNREEFSEGLQQLIDSLIAHER